MSFLDTLSNFFNKKETSVLGVDIGMSAIKVVQIKKKKGRAVLETYGELATGPYSGIEVGRAVSLPMEKIAGALKDILKESNVTTKSCGIAIPLSSSFITLIRLPAVDEKKLAEIVPLEARKYVPLPISEVLLDWWVIPSDDSLPVSIGEAQGEKVNGLDVLIVAIHNEALQKYSDISSGSGITPSFFEIELFSTLRSALVAGIESQVVLDIGAATSKLFIVERGVLKVSHTINRGSQDITLAISKSMNIPVGDAENLKRDFGLTPNPERPDLSEIVMLTLDYIFYEANRVILNYEKKFNKPIGKIVLSGGGSLLKGLIQLASNNFQTEVVLADPFQKLETPAFLKDVLKEAGPEFSVAIGLALRKLAEIQ